MRAYACEPTLKINGRFYQTCDAHDRGAGVGRTLGVETRRGLGVGVGAWRAVSAAVAQSVATTIYGAPYDHFAVGPDCRVTRSRRGRVSSAGSRPTIRAGIVSPAGFGDA